MKNVRRFIFISLVIIIFLFFILQAYQAVVRELSVDEFEHMHSSWLVSQGLVPYRDFFEHHNFLFWYLLSPLLFLFGESISFIFAARLFVFAVSVLVTVLLYLIGRELFKNRYVGLLAVLFVYFNIIYLGETVDVRPDLSMLFFSLLSLYLFILYFRKEKNSLLIASGILLSIAFLVKQTAVFFLLGMLIALWLRYFFRKSKKENLLNPLRQSFIYSLSFLGPGVIVLLIFYFLGGLDDFIRLAFIFNLKENTINEFSHFEHLRKTLNSDFIFWLFGLLGISLKIFDDTRKKKLSRVNIFLLPLVAVFFISNLLIPSVFAHYWLPLILVLTFYGGWAIWSIFNFLRKELSVPVAIFYLNLVFIIALVLSGLPCHALYSSKNFKQLDTVRVVLETTSPEDKMFDAAGSYIFRPDAYYYWIMPSSILTLYRQGKIGKEIIPSLEENDCRYTVKHFRLHYLPYKERVYIKKNYAEYKDDFMIRNDIFPK